MKALRFLIASATALCGFVVAFLLGFYASFLFGSGIHAPLPGILGLCCGIAGGALVYVKMMRREKQR